MFKIKKLLIPILLAITVLAACGKTWQIPEQDVARETEILDLFEAFFRHFMPEKRYERPKGYVHTYYLEIAGKNPPSDFLDRFNGYFYPVKNGSEFIKGRSVLLQIHSYKWVNANTVEVIGGHYLGELGSFSAPHIWEKENGKWILKSVGVGIGA